MQKALDITKDYSGLYSLIAGGSYKAMPFRLMNDVTSASQPSFEKREMANAASCARLIEEYPAFMQGLAAFQKYIDRKDMQSITPEDLGLWLTANLFGKDPSELSGQEIEVGNFTTGIVIRHLATVGT
ncbi:MAG: hypothetical protein JWO78_859 [Micavibrio sp.]|nr:hypothetical protein [Micavibrio sp.]